MSTFKQKIETCRFLDDDMNKWTTDQLLDYLTLSVKTQNQFEDKFDKSTGETKWDSCEIIKHRLNTGNFRKNEILLRK
jgi:hypothetical protein